MADSVIRFETKTVFNDDSIRQMFKAEYAAYEGLRMLLRSGLGILMAAAGLIVAMPLPVRGILMMIGCWFLVSPDFPGEMRAEQLLSSRRGLSSQVLYSFTEDELIINQGEARLDYSQLDRLLLDKNYFYLFQSRQNAVMLSRDSWSTELQQSFVKFISEKSGKEWKHRKSLLSMNLKDIREMLRDHIQKKGN